MGCLLVKYLFAKSVKFTPGAVSLASAGKHEGAAYALGFVRLSIEKPLALHPSEQRGGPLRV